MKPERPSKPDKKPLSQATDSDEDKIATEPSEADLWDLDDDLEATGDKPAAGKKPKISLGESEKRAEDEAAPAAITVTPRGPRRDNMPFKQNPVGKKIVGKPMVTIAEEAAAAELPLIDAPGTPKAGEPKIEAKIEAKAETAPAAKAPAKNAQPKQGPRKIDDTFDDLDAPAAGEKEIPEKTDALETVGLKEEKIDEPAEEISEPIPETSESIAAKSAVDKLLEESAIRRAAQTPIPVLPQKPGFSGFEKIGIGALLALLAGLGFFFLAQSIHKIPEKKIPLSAKDFPISGKKFQATKFDSYWRAPAPGETVRRGTELLPVIELGVTGGPAAIRILFKNSAGEFVGDAITRAINGPATLKISATAGFDDIGMLAAYRTGDVAPWTIEVREGPSANASGDSFKKAFEIPLSTEHR